MNFLVLGCSGMAGHLISIYLQEHGEFVLGYSRRKVTFCKNVNFNIYETDKLKTLIQNSKIDIVVNCIGVLNSEAEDNMANAVWLNSYLPHFLAQETRNLPTKIIQLSTDCVFSGMKGKYKDDEVPDGESFYDRSKALGELIDNKNLTFRNSIVGPDLTEDGVGLLNWFMKQKSISGFQKFMWSGVTTLVLAKAVRVAAYSGLSGLYQLSNNMPISKFDLCCLFNHYLRKDNVEIQPIPGPNLDKTLLRSSQPFDFDIPSYDQMVIDLKNWIDTHSSLYPHYYT